MAFNHEYPYVDSQIFNDDWLLMTVKKLVSEFADFVNLNTIKYADPISWDITRQYEKNTVVVDARTGNAYISTKPVPSGVQIINTDYWTQIYNYASVISTLREQIATDEGDTTTASQPFEKGQLVFVSGELYKVIADMIAGDSFVVDSNIKKTTIEAELVDLDDAIKKVTDDLAAEAEARADADSTLQNNIDDEATAREQADGTLQDNIDAEALTRSQNDDALAVLIGYNDLYNNVLKFNAVGDGTTDDTQAIVNAIAAAVDNKKPVYFPAGKYRITETIAIPEGVTLIGKVSDFSAWDDDNDLFSTIIIDTTIGATYPAFTCYYGVTVQYLKFVWKNNITGQTPSNYGPLFSSVADSHGTNIMADCTFKDLLLENASRGFYAKTGGRNVFQNIKADVTEYFVAFDEQRDSDYFDTIHIFPFASTTDIVRRNYIAANCNAFIFTNCDDMHLTNVLILATKRGILTQADSTASPSDYGAWLECDNVSFDGMAEECVYMAFPKYANFSNCRFVGSAGYNSCVFIAAQIQSKAIFTGCSFWFAKSGIINHGARVIIDGCTCEGNIATILQENGINSKSKISNSELYGNDNFNLPAQAELNGEQLIIGASTAVADLVASSISAVQTAIPTKYAMQILEFKTPDNGYGIININTDGTNKAQTIKFTCNGDYYHIPIISRIFLTSPNVQLIYQPTSASGGTISEIKLYDTSGKCDSIINEYKKHEQTGATFICSDYGYDETGYHATGVTNASLSNDLFKDGSTLLSAGSYRIQMNGAWKVFTFAT